MIQRPHNFRVDIRRAPGLVFAGLGNHAGGNLSYDSSPYGNDGTLTAMDPLTDWVWVPELGRWSNAFAINQYILLPGSPIGALSQFSMGIWCKKTTMSTSTFMFGRTNRATTTYDWGLYQNSSTQKFTFYVNTSVGLSYIAEAVASANGWRHLAATYDGANIRLYVDGSLAGAPTAQTGTLDTTSETHIGGGYNGRQWGEYGGGDLVDAVLYNRTLSLSEIQQIADPSNVMLDGLILSPQWTVFPSVAGGTTVDCQLATITITGLQATVEAATKISCSLATITATGLQATVVADTTISCSLATANITGLQSTVVDDTTISCSLATIQITGLQSTVESATKISCSLATIQITGLQATVSVGGTQSMFYFLSLSG